jgi:hypothetical protein
MKCAIMQPTYLPWTGYFALIASVDVFLFLDDVEFSRQSWQQRNRIKSQKGPQWLSVPARLSGRSHQLIREVEIDNSQPWRRRHCNSILMSYAKAAHVDWLRPWLQEVYQGQESSLCELNIRMVQETAGFLGLKTTFQRVSALGVSGDKVARLIACCRAVGADEYLSPVGSFGYIDADNAFDAGGVRLRYLHYEHPTYRQVNGEFVPYMAAVDLLLNEGPDSAAIIASGLKTPYTHEELRQVLPQHDAIPSSEEGLPNELH